MRVFVCIEISEEAKKEIIKVINELKNSGLIIAKYVEPQNLHITLKFFGEVNENEIEDIKKKIDSINIKKFEIKFEKLGYFTEEFVRVLWVGVENKELKVLNEEFEKLFGKEKREFNGHITFARVEKIRDKEKFKGFFSKLKVKPIKFIVDKIFIKKSDLTQKGPIYSNLYVKEFK